MVGLSQSQCQSEHNFIIVGGDGAVLTGLHYKNTRLYANDIKVMVGIYFLKKHSVTHSVKLKSKYYFSK